MGRNIGGQITHAVNSNFKEKIDKKAFKEANGKEMQAKVFSYEEKFRLKNMGKSIQKFLREKGINIKQVKDIKAEHIQLYLQEAKERGCTQQSINTYGNSLFKIEQLINRTYGIEVRWRENIVVPKTEKKRSTNRGAKSVIKREDYDKILKYAEENVSQSGQALKMQNWLGVRVEELVRISKKNIDLENRTILFKNTKGGKELIREIPKIEISFVKSVIEARYDKEQLFSIAGGTVNKYLNRVEERLDLEKHSNHDIRRLIAQEKYDSYKENGHSPKEALKKTSEWLSHGEKREKMLEQSYIKL